MVNYFEFYNIEERFHPDAAAVKSKYYELSRKYHPDRYTLADAGEQAEMLRLSSINNDAYKSLKDEYSTMKYLLLAKGVIEEEEKYNLPPDFLMEMMDLNEVVSELEMEPENQELKQRAQQLVDEQMKQWDEETLPLTKAYDEGDKSQELLSQIKDRYYRKKYLLRISDRMNNIN
ncbi:MAG: Fe-S protein assembly co-chaperone HscB [Chitinophagales bacterium]|nr:hypothetical protein [Chitinophagaceae bacterium]MCB9065192.1 Fe-S protein assembly co-chaperone HscB [Chitinophagales bacterium]